MKRRILLLCLVLTACGDRNTSVIDRQVLDEMEQREPKRVMPNQLVEEAYRQGRTLANYLLASSLDRHSADDSLSLATWLARQSYDTGSARVAWIDHRSDTARLSTYEQQLWMPTATVPRRATRWPTMCSAWRAIRCSTPSR